MLTLLCHKTKTICCLKQYCCLQQYVVDIGQRIQKQHLQTNQEQVSKNIYVGNLNKGITEDLNKLFGLKTKFYLRQAWSIEMPIEKNTSKSKGFAYLNVPQHVHNELIKLNDIEFQNHCIKIEEDSMQR